MQTSSPSSSLALSLFASLLFFSVHANSIADDRARFNARTETAVRIADEVPLEAGISSTVPAVPVQWQANSCTLDLNDQLLGGVKRACVMSEMDRTRCCPVLEAWLMAARAKVALQPPLAQAPGMPLLPDDSLVCIASMKAALESRGFYLTAPNSSCDVVTCFCGIRVNQVSVANCPLSFPGSNSSQPKSSPKKSNASSIFPIEPFESNNNGTVVVPSEPVGEPALASNNGTSGLSFLQALAANCTDHSYRGCTRCLNTLRKEITGPSSRNLGLNTTAKTLDCELIGLMWLLATNKTFYIPTVSAVLRALMYSDHPTKAARCSLDTANMPLALDYSEILESPAHLLIISQSWLCCTTILVILVSCVLVFL